jgi:hypothetical protein
MSKKLTGVFVFLLCRFAWCDATAVGVAPASASYPLTTAGAKDLFNSDLAALSTLEFENVSPNHLKIFGSEKAVDIVNFIKRRIKDVTFITKTKWADDPNNSLLAQTWPNGKMEVTAAFFKKPQVDRISTIIHEARHAELKDWPHVRCPKPYIFSVDNKSYRIPSDPSAGLEVSCDMTDQGAYAIQYTFLSSVAESCINCFDDVRQEAELYSIYNILFKIVDGTSATRLIRNSNKKPEELFNSMSEWIRIYEDYWRNKRMPKS